MRSLNLFNLNAVFKPAVSLSKSEIFNFGYLSTLKKENLSHRLHSWIVIRVNVSEHILTDLIRMTIKEPLIRKIVRRVEKDDFLRVKEIFFYKIAP